MPNAPEPDLEHRIDLVCEGGGVKGIGLAGAYAVLEERGYVVQNVAGTSAGAITAAAIAAGYSAKELTDIVSSLDFKRFEDMSFADRIPMAGKGLSVLLDRGIYEGKEFLQWMTELLAAKGVHTFKDLRTEWDDPRYRYRLQVIASDLTACQLLVLPGDAAGLGIDPDDLSVAEAVRMSMSIPIFFEPVQLENSLTNHQHVIVDGGMLSNFPVWLFDGQGVPDWPTFGLLLVEPDPKTPISERLPKPEHSRGGMHGLGDLVMGILHTLTEAHDRLYLEKATYARTIPIPTMGVRTTEFDLSRERTMELYNSGRTAAETFLETWDFEAYIAEFRTGKSHSRRDDLTAELKAVQPAGS